MTKSYSNGVIALNSVNLHISDHELVILLGPSGSGKTSMLRVIAGLEEPTAGKVSIDGRCVNNVPPHRRNVAMMFQRPALYPNRTVIGNLLFSMELQRPRPAGTEAAIATVVRMLGLEGLLDRYPGQLSGGQQQRLALGRALVRQAGVLLLDEPLSNLDAPLRLEIRRDLHLLRRHLPATILLVTHDPAEALALGDRIAVLDAGTLRQLATPVELRRRPAHEQVARMLCPNMGWLTGRLEKREARLALVTAAGAWQAPEHWSPHAGREVRVGIGPHDVALGSAGELAMDVTLVEPQPAGQLVSCASPAGSVAMMERDKSLTPGEKVMLKVNWPLTLVFDASTGALLAGPVA